ncbi:MAG TPA: hypothetical protein VMT61_05900 [Candidatus Binataceae bacterium]|nr:hypothetical protein [Candidatus Binataceae bacterium]
MFNSSVLDIAVGLIFTFLAVSLVVSVAVEALAAMLKWRSTTLLEGIKSLVNDPDLKGLALNLYNHALVSPRDGGTATKESDLKRLPSYIDPGQFADALISVAKIAPGAPDQINRAIVENIPKGQIQEMLVGIVNTSAGDVGKIRDSITRWFDNGMDRVSGDYKRRTQAWSFGLAFLVAALFNISTVAVAKALWFQPMIARAISPETTFSADRAIQEIGKIGLPVGWTPASFAQLWPFGSGSMEMIAGWLVTALAALFGAPFWFDALGQVVRLRGTGPSPDEKRPIAT